jgi:cytochrome c oxidase subunit IV
MRNLVERLNEIGFERSRRALAGLFLSLFITLYLMVSLNAPPGWGAAFIALAACYLVAFLGVVGEVFWGRWFASGLGWSGLMVAVFSLFMIGWSPPLAVYGVLHGLVVLALTGKKMAGRYDLQAGWRERYGMDEFAVARLRKTVTRAAASLPSLILWALGPKNPSEGMAASAAAIVVLLLAAASLRGMVLLRSWSILTTAAAAAGLWVLGSFSLSTSLRQIPGSLWLPDTALAGGALLSAVVLSFAVLPFAGPAIRFLRVGRR